MGNLVGENHKNFLGYQKGCFWVNIWLFFMGFSKKKKKRKKVYLYHASMTSLGLVPIGETTPFNSIGSIDC